MLPEKEFFEIIKKVPMIAVDGLLYKDDGVLLVKRSHEPFKNYWALPGGFVDFGERLEDAVVRETFEESGIKTKVKKIVGVYSDPKRDPRGHVITICFLLEYVSGKTTASDETSDVRFFKNLPDKVGKEWLKMINDAKKMIKKGE
jgi:8-oxo-dGTP diphosphatase